MSFTRQEVDALAHLARLGLRDDERTLITRQLGEIVAYARQIQAIETADLPPESASAAPLRDDVVQPSLDAAEAAGAAPLADASASLIKVPRVLG